MKTKVYIDGQAGTTGLQIFDRIGSRDDLELLRIAEEKRCRELGSYHCQGFDTFGPFKLLGGIAKGHPTEEEIRGAAAFYRELK